MFLRGRVESIKLCLIGAIWLKLSKLEVVGTLDPKLIAPIVFLGILGEFPNKLTCCGLLLFPAFGLWTVLACSYGFVGGRPWFNLRG